MPKPILGPAPTGAPSGPTPSQAQDPAHPAAAPASAGAHPAAPSTPGRGPHHARCGAARMRVSAQSEYLDCLWGYTAACQSKQNPSPTGT